MPANFPFFFYLYVVPIYLLPFFCYVRAMIRDSSDVINLCEDAGTESLNNATGSVRRGDELHFSTPY